MNTTFPPKVWDGVLGRLEGELPPFAVEAWLRPLTPLQSNPDASDASVGQAVPLRLLCPSSFHRDRVRDHFLGRIEALVREVVGGRAGVRLELPDAQARAEAGPAAVRRSERACAAPARTSPAPALSSTPQDEPGPVPTAVAAKTRAVTAKTRAVAVRPRPESPGPAAATAAPRRRAVQQSFDNFVIGPCNALAREALLAMARDQQMSLNQVYLCADAGMGKTHLCRAVAHEARSQAGQRVVYAAAEDFTNDFMSAIRTKDLSNFKRRYRKECDLLIVENVAFFEGKTQTQLEFFHTMRHVLDAGGRVLMTGDRLPRRQSGLDECVRDQIAGGFVAEMEPPDAQVRRDILRAKAAAGGVRIPPDCLDLLVESVRGSVRDLEGVLIQLVTTATLLKRSIDLDLTREALAKKCGAGPESPSGPRVEDVIGVVSTFFKTTRQTLCSRSRRRDILVPRQLAMYLSHRYTDASLTEIGRALGRDHPAVKNAVQKVERGVLERAPLRYQVESLCERLDELYGTRE
ncbi:MAG: DnaA ATPase domain-containing protein [Myxococcota bacterium]